MADRALVSVVLPCFNTQSSLPAALDSLLGQSYRDLEILAVDDGSSDGTLRILDVYASRESRIRVLRNETHHGLIRSLNRGVGEAGGQFIARLDADDVAAPRRIEHQVAALTLRPDIGVIGTAIALVGEDGRRRPRPQPLRCQAPGGARFAALLGTPLVHTTIMARAGIMRAHPYGGAPESLHTEDYEMFSRMLEAQVHLANLDEMLVTVRSRPSGVSLSYEQLQIHNFLACSRRHLGRTRDLHPDLGVHRVMVNRMDATTTVQDLAEGLRWLRRIERECALGEPDCAHEIQTAADWQRVDILTQAVLKGRSLVRLAAASLAVRYGHRMLSPAARQHLATKLSVLSWDGAFGPTRVDMPEERRSPGPFA